MLPPPRQYTGLLLSNKVNMLDPVIEEEEIGESEQRHGLEETNTGSKDSSESQQVSIRDPKRLSEEALLHALHNIRIEEEEELSFRRKSLHIVEIPTTVLPLPPTDAPSAETEPESSSEEQTSEEGAPYDRFSVYQLACSRERLRDMEQQLQNAVCMMQDTVELVARRMREQAKANTAGEGKEEVTTVVRSMRAQLDRLAGTHERVSLEHGLVAREMGARPGNLWEEMARRMGAM
ncbi:hypothetical protein B0T11DRAFT_336761 [Plectosphaerella cucumerina]|uniref:Uncharacterized protein n=1 Tax=Plectosphaerella cucumerina TaxID=40658 RepID=A0A8K0X511_9PEZI|nr:hypothetical protein B0T11DRAFT_336761 [Plectosphaerella cucumerina]